MHVQRLRRVIRGSTVRNSSCDVDELSAGALQLKRFFPSSRLSHRIVCTLLGKTTTVAPGHLNLRYSDPLISTQRETDNQKIPRTFNSCSGNRATSRGQSHDHQVIAYLHPGEAAKFRSYGRPDTTTIRRGLW